MKSIATSILMILYLTSYGQNIEFYTNVSKDTISTEEVISVKFVIKNGNGDFQAPKILDFDLIAGPNVSSSFSFVNGESSQEMSYEYLFKPRSTGVFAIPPAVLVTDEANLETQVVEITIVDPDSGIVDTDSSPMSPYRINETPVESKLSKDEIGKKRRKFRKI